MSNCKGLNLRNDDRGRERGGGGGVYLGDTQELSRPAEELDTEDEDEGKESGTLPWFLVWMTGTITAPPTWKKIEEVKPDFSGAEVLNSTLET